MRRGAASISSAFTLVVALALGLSACESLTMWFAPNTSCADWQHMADDKRSAIADEIIRGSALFEQVRVEQHAPIGTTEDRLVSMAVASITKNCDGQRWSPTMRVKDIVRDLYVPDGAVAAA